nr:transcription factor HHO2-like [Quercus suber]
MKVDGLTNDEVKSHLQKYRLHTRRPSPTTIHNNGNLQAPQFVVVGGIWVQPPEYSGAVTATTTSGEVYAPMAAVQPASSSQIQRLQKDPSSLSDERFSHSGNRGCSNSPATSSSTHTTTTSPVF